MSVIARTLTINAAFLQEIKEDNRQLKKWMATTRKLFSRPSSWPVNAREGAEALSQLRDQLAMHFALENAFGYFEDAVAQAPRLSQRAEELHDQHRVLFLDICALADRAEGLLYARQSPREWRALAEACRGFFDQFDAHENAENELIVGAFDDDIGVGD